MLSFDVLYIHGRVTLLAGEERERGNGKGEGKRGKSSVHVSSLLFLCFVVGVTAAADAITYYSTTPSTRTIAHLPFLFSAFVLRLCSCFRFHIYPPLPFPFPFPFPFSFPFSFLQKKKNVSKTSKKPPHWRKIKLRYVCIVTFWNLHCKNCILTTLIWFALISFDLIWWLFISFLIYVLLRGEGGIDWVIGFFVFHIYAGLGWAGLGWFNPMSTICFPSRKRINHLPPLRAVPGVLGQKIKHLQQLLPPNLLLHLLIQISHLIFNISTSRSKEEDQINESTFVPRLHSRHTKIIIILI